MKIELPTYKVKSWDEIYTEEKQKAPIPNFEEGKWWWPNARLAKIDNQFLIYSRTACAYISEHMHWAYTSLHIVKYGLSNHERQLSEQAYQIAELQKTVIALKDQVEQLTNTSRASVIPSPSVTDVTETACWKHLVPLALQKRTALGLSRWEHARKAEVSDTSLYKFEKTMNLSSTLAWKILRAVEIHPKDETTPQSID